VELDNHLKNQLSELLADPAKAGPADRFMLQELIQEYPYFQPLHLLLARALMQEPEKEQVFATAAFYTGGTSLHNFIKQKEFYSRNLSVIALSADQHPATSQPHEILHVLSAAATEQPAETENTEYRPFRNGTQPAAEAPRRPSPEHDFAVESIASSDFFAFEQNFGTEAPAEIQEQELQVTAPVQTEEKVEPAEPEEKSSVSNYHDEKLPYTFLWWLAKTRKEHQSIFQPYAVQKTRTNDSPELQQQYVEHIFHLQSPLTGQAELPEAEDKPKHTGKEFELIESFIKNDPQINPPKAEQIDTENKAKKSAEDQNDLVSETLANIYIEQMLYDKAIDTYEKLSLKFPEKSRYFADLIQGIQKKI